MTSAGDSRDQAIPRLLEEHGGRLYGLGLRLCGGRADAEDLVQETFLAAYRHWDQFEGRSDPRTWLYTIAARACRRMHRKRAGEPQHMESYEELLPFGEPAVGVPSSSEMAGLDAEIRREGIERVEQAIVTLPITFRLPLVLKDIVGLSVADVAAILGLKPATVKTRVHRARMKLRGALEQVLPKAELAPPAYSKQVCLDLLHAKQEALDRGVELPQDVVCDRCRAVFASMDLAADVCTQIGRAELPPELRELLLAQMG